MSLDKLLQEVCDYYEFGKLLNQQKLKGGRSHITYKVETEKGNYVIKELQPSHKKELDYGLFRNTSAIAYVALKNKLPAVPALIRHNDVIFETNASVFMAYPFVVGKMIRRKDITLQQGERVTEFLAQMHLLDLDVPAASYWQYRYQSDVWKRAYDFLQYEHKFGLSALIERLNKQIRLAFTRYIEFKSSIESDMVISHRDIDPYNVLWLNENDYAVIDWDLAGYVDAAVELMYVAIGFSHVDHTSFDFNKFHTMTKKYQSIRTIKTRTFKPLFYTIMANWLNWCQERLLFLVSKEQDLATINNIIVSVRHSLESFEYMLTIEDQIRAAFE